MRRRLPLVLVGCLAAMTSIALPGAGASTRRTTFSTCGSARACGGMKALIQAAEKEGKLNVIALPPTWANYGTIMKQFEHKYHIKIADANPTGSSAQEIQAIDQLRGSRVLPTWWTWRTRSR